MNANNVVTSLIRTCVPFLVGAIITLALKLGFPDATALTGSLTEVLTFLIGAAYYTAVRFAEHKWPSLGWLLGKPVMPSYPVKVDHRKVTTQPMPAAPTVAPPGTP